MKKPYKAQKMWELGKLHSAYHPHLLPSTCAKIAREYSANPGVRTERYVFSANVAVDVDTDKAVFTHSQAEAVFALVAETSANLKAALALLGVGAGVHVKATAFIPAYGTAIMDDTPQVRHPDNKLPNG